MMGGATPDHPPLVLVWGDDDFAVKRRARQVFLEWTSAAPGADEEIIDATAGNGDEVSKVLKRVREALQTLPFFGGTKSIWVRDCNFMGEDRVSEGQAVIEALGEWVQELAAFRWDGVRLLISAGRIDRRRSFYKGLDRLGVVEHFPGLNGEDREWREKGESLAAGEFRGAGRRIGAEALSAFVEQVGPNARALAMEAQKLVAYAGERAELCLADVEAVVTRGRHARAFALADAFGERNLPRALRRLDEELWSMQSDKQKSEIGLLYGLISKVRAMLLAKELELEGWLRPASDYRAFTAQLAQLKTRAEGRFPTDRRYNPLDINSYVMFRASQHARNFSRAELVAAMVELLRCNRLLVGSSLEGGMVIQLALARLLAPAPSSTAPRRPGPGAPGGPLAGRTMRT